MASGFHADVLTEGLRPLACTSSVSRGLHFTTTTRAVVERRQQIGMLRALGFQREMVSWVFLIESYFVALLGIGLGVGLALIPASQMISDMAIDIPGLTFQVPWKEILVVSGLAYGMTLLTTWLPAVQASRVRPAEALRYE
jgi:putative ABC transport system permease protein